MPIKNIEGMKFGALTAVRRVGTKNRCAVWQCVCDCGRIVDVAGAWMASGNTKSCGCRATVVIHGNARKRGNRRMSTTAEYHIWTNMKQRCHNPRQPRFADWGGRGIAVCERWRNDFAAFIADMSMRPSSLHSIDRIDNDRGYEPGNCRWATPTVQAANRTRAS